MSVTLDPHSQVDWGDRARHGTAGPPRNAALDRLGEPEVRGWRWTTEPVLRSAPDVKARRTGRRRRAVSARMPLIEDLSRPSSMAVPSRCTTVALP